jgi:hypothetical protein
MKISIDISRYTFSMAINGYRINVQAIKQYRPSNAPYIYKCSDFAHFRSIDGIPHRIVEHPNERDPQTGKKRKVGMVISPYHDGE